MIKSKGIRTLCYIAMGVSYLLAFVLIIYGFNSLHENQTETGLIQIVAGVLVPIIVNLSLYPVFALSLIESNISDLNDNMEKVTMLLSTVPQTSAVPAQKPTSTKTNSNGDTLEEAIGFINNAYHIQIEMTDDPNAIKEKILKIDPLYNSTSIFKERINNADSLNQIFAIIKLHYTVLSVNKK